MIAAVETYLAVRRAVGFTLSNTEYLLRSFAGFATDQKQTHIRTATAIEWASQARSVAQRHAATRPSASLPITFAPKTPGMNRLRRTTLVIGSASRPAHLFAARDRRPCPRRHEASIGRLVAAPDIYDVDRSVGGNRPANLGGVESAGFRHHTQRFADSQNQVPENPIGAVARDCSGGPRLAT